MKRLVVLSLFAIFIAVNAQCNWGWGFHEGRINLCATLNYTKCDLKMSGAQCRSYNTLNSTPALSGYTEGDYLCKIYKEFNCKGPMQYVNKIGMPPFTFSPKSFLCPCTD